MYKVISMIWITQMGSCTPHGVCVTENSVGMRKIRVGMSRGDTEEEDTQHIAATGGHLSVDALERMLEEAKATGKFE